MSEEAAVVQKPVRPGREGAGRKRAQEVELVGEGQEREGGNDPVLGKMRSM